MQSDDPSEETCSHLFIEPIKGMKEGADGNECERVHALLRS